MKKFNPEWVTGDQFIDDSVIDWTERFAKNLAPIDKYDKSAMTTTQIRKFFGEMKRIQADYNKYKSKIPFLKAQLAYAVGRNPKSKIKYFYEEISEGISKVQKKEDYDRLVSIVESIVAFHKYHGGD